MTAAEGIIGAVSLPDIREIGDLAVTEVAGKTADALTIQGDEPDGTRALVAVIRHRYARYTGGE